MTRNLRITVFAVCAFLYLGEISTSEARQDKDPFHELVRLTASENNDTMSTKTLDSILHTLGERIKNLKDCFSLDKLGHLVSPEGEISDSGFANISDILIDFIMMTNCSDVRKDATAKPHVNEIIKSLHIIEYESKHGIEKCFNAFGLRESSGNPSQLHATIILYLYEGQCILPEKSYFLTEYRGYFKNENGVATKEVFENLIYQLGIGGDDAHDHGHDDHSDHSGEKHDQGTHDDDESDHKHHDNDDHNFGDHDDDHSDDVDSHDDHNEGGHSHAEDHGDDHSEGGDDHDEDHSDDVDTHDDHNEGGHSHAEDHGDDHSEEGDDHDEDHSDDVDTHDDHSEGGHSHVEDHGDDHSEGGDDHDEDHGAYGDDHNEGGHDHDEDHDDDHSEEEQGRDGDHSDDGDEGHGHGEGGSNPDQDELNRKRRDAHEEHDDEHPKERCFSAEQLLDIFEIDGEITEERAVELCPALVQQMKSGACKADKHDDHGSSTPDGYTEAMAYGYGTASVALISFLALIGFAAFPVLKIKSYKFVMQFFIGLGIGTMATDAIVHIIPHTLGVHKHDAHNGHEEEGHEEDLTYIWKMSVVAGGLYIFFFFENCLRLWKRTRTENPKTSRAHEVYANTPQLRNSSEKKDSENAVTSFSNISENDDAKYNTECTSREATSEKELEEAVKVCGNFTTTLITVFVGDMLHNFADGVAIGVSFTNSWSTGIGTSIAILCHELPHEIGDFAIYLKNGASKWQAVGLNFAAACFAFVGLYAGIGMGRDEVVRTWLMAAVAGMFLYIALVQVMNEMVREQTTKPVLQFIVQNLGLVFGWAILTVIALYEGKLQTSIG